MSTVIDAAGGLTVSDTPRPRTTAHTERELVAVVTSTMRDIATREHGRCTWGDLADLLDVTTAALRRARSDGVNVGTVRRWVETWRSKGMPGIEVGATYTITESE